MHVTKLKKGSRVVIVLFVHQLLQCFYLKINCHIVIKDDNCEAQARVRQGRARDGP